MEKIKILMLAACPDSQRPLRLDEEARQIDRKIQEAEYRDSVELITAWAARPDDLQLALMRHKPHVVHFCGHGSSGNELVLQGDHGKERVVTAETLGQLFGVLKDNIRLVVLNACYSAGQADAIVEHIECAIGMNRPISDGAAIDFAGALYRAIANGRTVEEAFQLGTLSVRLEQAGNSSRVKEGDHRGLAFGDTRESAAAESSTGEQTTPKLFAQNGVDPSTIRLVNSKNVATKQDSSLANRGIQIGGSVSSSNFVTGDGNSINITPDG